MYPFLPYYWGAILISLTLIAICIKVYWEGRQRDTTTCGVVSAVAGGGLYLLGRVAEWWMAPVPMRMILMLIITPGLIIVALLCIRALCISRTGRKALPVGICIGFWLLGSAIPWSEIMRRADLWHSHDARMIVVRRLCATGNSARRVDLLDSELHLTVHGTVTVLNQESGCIVMFPIRARGLNFYDVFVYSNARLEMVESFTSKHGESIPIDDHWYYVVTRP